MATIKSFTSLVQSKMLAKFLPHESADLYYSHEFVNSAGDYYKLNIASEGYFDDEEHLGSDIPCWSLAALLGVLEDYLITKTSKDCIIIVCNGRQMPVSSLKKSEIDACVTMIIRLHELKLI